MSVPAGRHDSKARRRAVRGGRQRGCSVYIPAEALERAGFDPADEPPFYSLAGTGERGRYIVTLHREGDVHGRSVAASITMRNSAEHRKCPKCERKAALRIDGSCRWDDCDYVRGSS